MVKSVNASWWVQRWSELQPDKPAILFEDSAITYWELNRRSNRTACWLQYLGIEKGDRVAVLLDNCPEFVELYLACSRLGAIFVPLNFRLAAPEIDYIIKHSAPRLFVFSHGFRKAVHSLDLASYRPPLLCSEVGGTERSEQFEDYHAGTSSFDGQLPFVTSSMGPADPEEPHVIMYTSGTTGRPKGAVLSHRKTFFNCLNAEIFFQLSFDDCMLIVLPMFHSGGLFIQASPIIYKGATILVHRRFDPAHAYADIERHRVTKLLGVPTVFRQLLSVEPQQRGDLSSLRVCAIGGEKVTPELLDECWNNGFPLRQIMGQTETSILLWASEEESIRKPGTVGRPVFHSEVALRDRQGRPVGVNQVGEIVVRGSIMMKEYWRDPVQTEQTFTGGWLRTGDLARVDEDGYFYLVDRAREMFISGGENVYPAEVERVLREHPAIEDAAVIGIPDASWGEVGVAFVIRLSGSALSKTEVVSHCRDRLAAYKVPTRVVFREEFPRTPLGKIRKFLLKPLLDESDQ